MSAVKYKKSDGIAYITINRPEVKNALNRDVFDRLSEIWDDFSEDDDTHVAILKGADNTFSAGFDLEMEIDHVTGLTNEEIRRRHHESIGGLARGKRIYKPVIAAIEGWCLAGGVEVALACDIRVADEDARFGAFNIREGLPLADGGSVRLPLVVGLGNTMELALTGKHVKAERAEEMDLVNRVAPSGKAVDYAEKYAEMILQRPQSGIRGQKETILDTVAGGNLDQVLREEGYRAMSFHDSDAWQELPRKFVEGEFRDDMEDRRESLDEAFEDV